MSEDFLLFVAVGFAAQMVDGAIGMAYGVASSTVLMSMGIPPATASACVHAAETFTTAASGASHWRLGNIDKKLVWRLAIPGMIGRSHGGSAITWPRNTPPSHQNPVSPHCSMARRSRAGR